VHCTICGETFQGENKMLGASWKPKLFALGVMALGFAGPVLNHYVHLAGLNWITFCNTSAVILGGGGLMYVKQADVHGGTTDTGTRPAPVPITVAPPVPGAVAQPEALARQIDPTIPQSLNRKGVQREDLP
jgi:hypothetical protein